MVAAQGTGYGPKHVAYPPTVKHIGGELCEIFEF